MKIVECVPNFSEGRDKTKIDAIVAAMGGVAGVQVLDVDPGCATNRTVVTIVGEPEAVLEGAFQGIAKAGEIIDMSVHKGEHPRMGATDVCPFVPITGITMEECAGLARRLAKRVAEELKIPTYLYEAAAAVPERKSLAWIREGEYEALPKKLQDPKYRPDFGAAVFNPKSGATVIGARPFLIAYNINLNTRDKKLANAIAFALRERGTAVKGPDGKVLKDPDGNTIYEPGLFKEVRAVGWVIEEYGCAQISINLLNYEVSSIHAVFDAACRLAEAKGLRVTGSEIVGMTPLEPLLMAGRHYLALQGKCTGQSEEELVHIAVKSLGLKDVAPFDPHHKIIEWRLGLKKRPLVSMTLRGFANELASDSPAPGGGSVAAYCGALGAGLSAMVANLTFGAKDYLKHNAEMEAIARKGQSLKERFLHLVDADTDAFNAVMAAMRLPKKTDEERAARQEAIVAATRGAIATPMQVMEASLEVFPLAQVLIKKGNQNALSDATVSALAAETAARGAFLNVLINLPGLPDEAEKKALREKAEGLLAETEKGSKAAQRAALKKL
jgi:glutamate formiminotransferase/formiminotetrahydrofolate cyclodeaminase